MLKSGIEFFEEICAVEKFWVVNGRRTCPGVQVQEKEKGKVESQLEVVVVAIH